MSPIDITNSTQNSMKILDLGCGKRKRPGAIGLDINPRSNADVIHDLSNIPYPFEDESFDEIFIDNVLEHMANPIRTMEEVHRICKHGSRVKVIVPYFRSVWAFIDPTHVHFFTVNSFSYFDPRNPICHQYEYTQARFEVESIVFNESIRTGWIKSLLVRIANKFPLHYEIYLSHLFPLDDITYYLRKP